MDRVADSIDAVGHPPLSRLWQKKERERKAAVAQ